MPDPRPIAAAGLLSRITVDPEMFGGRPCIRGMRVRVVDALDLLAGGLTPEGAIAELPYLEPEDIRACLMLAARQFDHPLLVA